MEYTFDGTHCIWGILMTATSAKTNQPVRQGLISITGTFIDTIIICSVTGLGIVLTGAWQVEGLEGVAVTTYAFQKGLLFNENVTGFFLMMSLTLFAFTTILGWNYYSERCIVYLCPNKPVASVIYRILYILAVFVGPYMTVTTVWSLADIQRTYGNPQYDCDIRIIRCGGKGDEGVFC